MAQNLSSLLLNSSALTVPASWQQLTRVTTAGAGSYTVPAGVFWLRITVIGGGGGGSNGFTGGAYFGGAGGGAGGAARKTIQVTPGQVIAYTVGAGGNGGAYAAGVRNGGTAGGASTCSGMTANGGATPATGSGGVQAGGVGGTASGGDVNVSGGAGASGSNSLNNNPNGSGGGGVGDVNGPTNGGVGSIPIDSAGSVAAGGNTGGASGGTSSGVSAAPSQPGAGGGGGYCGANGGPGAAGAVIFECSADGGGSGQWVTIQEVTISATVNTVDFTNLAVDNYDGFELEAAGVMVAGVTNASLQFGVAGVWDAGATDYNSAWNGGLAGGNGSAGSSLINVYGSNLGGPLGGIIRFGRMAQAAEKTWASWFMCGSSNPVNGGGSRLVAKRHDSIRFSWTGMNAGKFILRGKKA